MHEEAAFDPQRADEGSCSLAPYSCLFPLTFKTVAVCKGGGSTLVEGRRVSQQELDQFSGSRPRVKTITFPLLHAAIVTLHNPGKPLPLSNAMRP